MGEIVSSDLARKTNMVQLSEVVVGYKGADSAIEALWDVDLDISEGEVIGVIGPSGSGKSTLGRLLLGILPRIGARLKSGEVSILGQDISSPGFEKLLGRKITYIPQELLGSFDPRKTIEEHFKLGIVKIDENELFQWFTAFQFDDVKSILKSYPHQLSGGQLKRILIIMAFSSKPEIILADELTSGLDKDTIQIIRRHIESYLAVHNPTMIIISHDLEDVISLLSRIILVQDGRIIEDNTFGKNGFVPTSEFGKALMNTAHDRSLTLPISVSNEPERVLVQLDHISKYYNDYTWSWGKKNKIILKDLNLVIYVNEIIGISGVSGSGKSTLGNIVAGIINSTKGKVNWLVRDDVNYNNVKYQAQIVFQNPATSLDPLISVKKQICEVIQNNLNHYLNSSVEDVYQNLMKEVGLPERYEDRVASQLSGGEQQRICIARALAARPKLLVCDEILSALDVITRASILALLSKLVRTYHMSILFISHDIHTLQSFCGRCFELIDGQLKKVG